MSIFFFCSSHSKLNLPEANIQNMSGSSAISVLLSDGLDSYLHQLKWYLRDPCSIVISLDSIKNGTIEALYPFILHHPLLNKVAFKCPEHLVEAYAARFREVVERTRKERKQLTFYLWISFDPYDHVLPQDAVKSLHSYFDVIDDISRYSTPITYRSVFKRILRLDVDFYESSHRPDDIIEVLLSAGVRDVYFHLPTGDEREWTDLKTVAKIFPQVRGLRKVKIISLLTSPGWRHTMYYVAQQLAKVSSAGNPLKLVLEFAGPGGGGTFVELDDSLEDHSRSVADAPVADLDLEVTIAARSQSSLNVVGDLSSRLNPILSQFALVGLLFTACNIPPGWVFDNYADTMTRFGRTLLRSQVRLPRGDSISSVPAILPPLLEFLEIPFRVFPVYQAAIMSPNSTIKRLRLKFDSEIERWESVPRYFAPGAGIERLELYFAKYVPEEALIVLLQHVLSWKHLEHLTLETLGHGISNPEILRMLLTSKLQSLDLLSMSLGHFTEVFELLAENTTLNHFGQMVTYRIANAADCEALRMFLQKNSTLQSLRLRIEINIFDEDSVKMVRESIISQFERNTTLRRFTMEYNDLATEVRHANITMRNLHLGIASDRDRALIVAKHRMGESPIYDKNLANLISTFVVPPLPAEPAGLRH